ncbi:uncharacterized protein [Centruroides vittatus]|uniref:uncharacterized protein n=1 Tax=Centruroides vittatus TaxID=120091 RepID=UPI00350FB21A
MAEGKDDLEYMTRKIKEEYFKGGLYINMSKTKYLSIGGAKTDMELEGEKIEGCEHYNHLEIQIHQDGRDVLEINTRLAQAEAWRMTGEEKRKVTTVEMDALRRLCRILKRERITNEKIKDLIGLKETVLEDIWRKQLIWFGM